MARSRSSLKKLPREILDECNRLLQDGRYTIVQVTEHLQQLGADVSKSSVHRYSQQLAKFTEDIRLAREISNAVGRELADLDDSNGTEVLVESLQALLMRVRMQQSAEDVDADTVAMMARAVKDLQAAQKSSVDMRLKLRQQIAKEAAKVAEVTGKQHGLTADTIEAIKAGILGVAQ